MTSTGQTHVVQGTHRTSGGMDDGHAGCWVLRPSLFGSVRVGFSRVLTHFFSNQRGDQCHSRVEPRLPRGRLFQGPFTLFTVSLSPTGGLDLIFMPGLGFDKHGNRLGRGRGYYDAYLRRCLQQQDVPPYTMALAFREQICPQVPVDENDMKVDEVLYEESST